MTIEFRIARLLGIAALLLVAGCKSLHSEPQMAVVVRDAETKVPIAGASIRLGDLGSHLDGSAASTSTGTDGSARIAALPDGNDGLLMVSATGYLTGSKPLYETKPVPSATSAASVDASKRTVEIELYAGPRPSVELVLPTDFRGLIKAELVTSPAAAGTPSARQFRVAVASDGAAQIVGPPVIHSLQPQDIHAVTADGKAVPSDGPAADVALRWVKTTETTIYFVYGTEADCKAARKTLTPTDGGHGGDSGSGSGKSGDRRGGGRRGGGPSTPSTSP